MNRVFAIALVGWLVACATPAPAPGVTQTLGTAGKLVTGFATDMSHIYWTTCYYADGVNATGKVARRSGGFRDFQL